VSKKFSFVSPYTRRMPDPLWPEVQRHIMYVPVRNVPADLPMGANPRGQNTDKMVYRQVEESLLSEDRMFHLKHKGITVVASRVDQVDGTKDTYIVEFDEASEKQGVLDGGHSYRIIMENEEQLPDDQFIKFEILTGIDPEWIPDIAGGLNTSVQVQPMSLFNLREQFEWLKEELKSEAYADQIAWRENDKGEFDARDVISLMYCFDVFAYPNTDMSRFPIQAYSGKAAVLKEFEKNQDEFKRLRPILRDILVLSDRMSSEAKDLYNQATGGRGGRAHFIEHRDSSHKPFHFTFLGVDGHDRLMNGALYPMLAAFRWMAEEDATTGLAKWKRPFQEVLEMWQEIAGELFVSSLEMGRDLGYNVNALGKNKTHWANLYKAVAMKDLMAK
jgi:AIPR protein